MVTRKGTPLHRLGRQVDQALDAAPSERRRQGQKQALMGLLTAEPKAPYRIRALIVDSLLLLALTTVLLIHLFLPLPVGYRVGEDKTFSSAEGRWVRSPDDRSLPLAFEGGSRLELDKGTTVRIVASTQEEVRIELSQGRIGADIHGRGEQWVLDVGAYRITVLGTIFSVLWRAEEEILEVFVSRGSVWVQGGHLGEHGIRLEEGDHLTTDESRLVAVRTMDEEPSPSLEADPPREPPPVVVSRSLEGQNEPRARRPRPAEPREDDIPPAAPPAPRVPHVAPPRRERPATEPLWKKLLRQGSYTEALVEAERLGLEGLLHSEGCDALWGLADGARYIRQGATAQRILMTLRRRFPHDPRTSTATFLLGRLALEQGDPDGARVWLALYLREAPRGPLAEEALGRLIDACVRGERRQEALEHAEAYLALYPKGLFARLARSMVNPPSGQGGGK